MLWRRIALTEIKFEVTKSSRTMTERQNLKSNTAGLVLAPVLYSKLAISGLENETTSMQFVNLSTLGQNLDFIP